MSYSLFTTESTAAGYRLNSVEVYNWGTFDGEIFKIEPEGNTTLITGANGSGKTTFIEGILTLLVPEKRMRFYNLASGSSNKNQRDEEGYVLGEYGDTEDDQNGNKKSQKLREKSKAYSLLLAVFKNEEKYVTLCQVRWFSGTGMKREYLIAQKLLTIESDLTPFDPNGLWKKRLKQKYPKVGGRETIEFFDGPVVYARAFRKLFGMRSEKATTLFSQVIGLKILGNLDEFIRTNMLEEGDSELEFVKLKDNFQVLLKAHQEMEKAEEQLKLLKPIKAKYADIEKLKDNEHRLTILKDTVSPYFSHHKEALLSERIDKRTQELVEIERKIENLRSSIEEEREQEKTLEISLRTDETGQEIRSIDEAIKRKNQQKSQREERLKKYNVLASKLELQENPTDSLFDEQKNKARAKQLEIDKELSDSIGGINIKWSDARNKTLQLKEAFQEKVKDLEQLLSQKNNITGRVAEIRKEILEYTGATEAEIPFVGELIQVSPKAKSWEYAIEKVLRNFALNIIVPDKYYTDVNDYVNDNKLRGKIVYHRNKGESFLNEFSREEEGSIFSKVEVRQDSAYADWIEYQIKTFHNFICTSKDELQHFPKAVTKEGLIKNGSRHEKDDRENHLRKESFVLGWDNKEKVKLVKETLKELDKAIKASDAEIGKLEKRKSRLETEKGNINTFLTFELYEEIDWKVITKEIHELQRQKDILEASNNKIKELKKQLEGVQKLINEKEEQKENLISAKSEISSTLGLLKKQHKDCKDKLSIYEGIELTSKYEAFEQYLGISNKLYDLETIDEIKDKSSEKINGEFNSVRGNIHSEEKRLLGLLRDFKEPDDELRKRFPDWLSDTHRLSLDPAYINDYLELHDKIEKDELIDHKNRFKKYLNEDMINKMADFKTLLDRQEEDILDSIESLNKSLKNITFRNNPLTFIQLYAEKDNSKKIKDFRVSLIEWKPNLAEFERTKDDSILEESFLKIKRLIEELSSKDEWRREVTDVRNWLRFVAKEHMKEDEKRVHRIYENTGKLSSGEQAQLTYTIMGAAIAYQYGILQDGLNTNSFRFICVDEAFTKQDEEKATYLMEFIKQLHLQMLLVTPNDNIDIAEPYISRVHYVQRVNQRNSLIFDMPIGQFVAEKEKWLSETQAEI